MVRASRDDDGMAEETMSTRMRYMMVIAAIGVACCLTGYREVRYLVPPGHRWLAHPVAADPVDLGTIRVTPVPTPRDRALDPIRAAPLDRYAGHARDEDRARRDRVLEKSIGLRARGSAAAMAMNAAPEGASGGGAFAPPSGLGPASRRLLVLVRTLLFPI
jgi:hypothetical protein